MRLSYTREAQDDIESIYEYIGKEAGIATADRMVDAIVGTCEDLVLFPEMGHRRPELDDFNLEVRTITERSYAIFYTEHAETLHVVRVLHGARDIGPADLDGLINLLPEAPT